MVTREELARKINSFYIPPTSNKKSMRETIRDGYNDNDMAVADYVLFLIKEYENKINEIENAHSMLLGSIDLNPLDMGNR